MLADSLNTQQNYVLDASPVALRLGVQRVCHRGDVRVWRRALQLPAGGNAHDRLLRGVLGSKGGSQFVNQADVGGVYDGQWIMATSRWVTKVFAPSKPLPRTGY